MNKFVFCLLLILTVSAHGQSTLGADEAAAGITQLREGLVSNFQKGDIDGLLRYLDPDVVVTWQNGEVCHGPQEVRAFYRRMMSGEQRVVRDLQSNPEVLGRHVYGDWGVSWGNLHDHFVLNDGSDLPFNSVFTATIAKRGDRWLVVAFHTSVSVFDNPVLSISRQRIGLWASIGGGALGLTLGALLGWWFLGRKRGV